MLPQRSAGSPQRLITPLPEESGAKAASLRLLGASGDPFVVAEIAAFVWSRDPNVREAARFAVRRLLRGLTPSDWGEFDELLRDRRSCDLTGTWWNVTPTQIGDLLESPDERILLTLAATHHSGHVRERAVHLLAEWSDGSELAPLLLRINDWVEPIRKLALAAIRARLRPECAGQFIRCVPLVQRLESCGRNDHGAILSEIDEFLLASTSREALEEGVHSPQRATRRFCLRLAERLGGLEGAALVRRAICDPDPATRLWGARRALRDATADDFLQVGLQAARDSVAAVRQEGLRALAEHQAEGTLDLLTAALFDRHRGVCDLARFYLRRDHPDLDLVELYLRCLTGTSICGTASAIRGLGDIGSARDADLVGPYLDAAEPSIRAAAIAAIGRLALETYLESVLIALESPSPRVSREATRALLPKIALVPPTRLTSLLSVWRPHFQRSNALRLVTRLDRWTQLPLLLPLAADPDFRVSQQALREISRWVQRGNRSYIAPTQPAARATREALALSRSALPKKLTEEIESDLRAWTR